MAIVNMDATKLNALMWESQELDDYIQDKAQDINKLAATIFTAEEVKTNEERTSETTPPKYLASFRTKRNSLPGAQYSWIAYNDDPAALWVEVGAHAGKARTRVLKYRPYGRALDLLRIR